MSNAEKFRESKRKLDELDRKIADAEKAERIGKKLDSYAPFIAIVFMFILFLMYLLK
jgi:hypothetical protein